MRASRPDAVRAVQRRRPADGEQATDILLRYPKVAAWLDRYPPKPQTEAEYRPATDEWVVKAWSGRRGRSCSGRWTTTRAA